MKRKFLGFLFAICLILPCGVLLTACGEKTYTLSTNVQNATINLQTDKAKEGDLITFDVAVNEATENYVYELDRVYYLVEGNEQENVLESDSSTYSFTMPAGNVTICVDVNENEIYKDYVFYKGALRAYDGDEINITNIPTSYSLYDTNSYSRVITFNSVQELNNFRQSNESYNFFIYSSGQYYVKATVNGESREEEFVTANDVLSGYFDGLIESATQSLKVEIRLTSYELKWEDFSGSEEALGSILRPFFELDTGHLSSFTMSTANGETIEVTQDNFDNGIMEEIEEIFSNLSPDLFPISYTYGNYYLMTEGNDYKVTSIAASEFIGSGVFNYSNIESIVIPSNIETIGNLTFRGCENLQTVIIENSSIYNELSYDYACGYLIAYANTIKVLKTIVDDVSNNNEYLNSIGGYIKTEEGNYYIYSM